MSNNKSIRVPFTFAVGEFLFTTDPQLFSFRHPGVGEGERGMSGCIYGPSVPFAGELWHITCRDRLQILQPFLLAPDAPVDNVPQLDNLPMEFRPYLPRDFGIAILCQIALVKSPYAAYSLAMNSPVFMPELGKARVLFVPHYQNMGNGLVYDRKAWPEPAVVTYGALSLKAPRVGPDKIRSHVDDNGVVVCELANTTFFAANPEGRGSVLYKVVRDEERNYRVYSTSSFGGEVHPPREIDVTGDFSVRDFVGLLIERRLGDLIVMQPYELDGFIPSSASSKQVDELVRNEDFIFHPQHGVIKMRKGDGIYAIKYGRPSQ